MWRIRRSKALPCRFQRGRGCLRSGCRSRSVEIVFLIKIVWEIKSCISSHHFHMDVALGLYRRLDVGVHLIFIIKKHMIAEWFYGA